jgi:cytochrome c-type biogenesis protein CcmH/NrfG
MPDAEWQMLLARAPIDARRRERIASIDELALDQLAAELNEYRSFDPLR